MLRPHFRLVPLLALAAVGGCRGCVDDQPTAIAPQIYLDACDTPQRKVGDAYIGGFEDCAVDFGEQDISVKVTRTIKVTNPSVIELNFKNVEIIGDPTFVLELAPDSIGPGLSGSIVVSVRPRVAATLEAILAVRTDASNTAQTPEGDSLVEVPLTVAGVDNGVPDISVTPDRCDFRRVPVSGVRTCDVVVTNNGSRGLVLDSVAFAAVDPATPDVTFQVPPGSAPPPYAPFAFTGRPPGADEEIAPGASVTVQVRFTPDVLGNYQGLLRVLSNDPDTDTIDLPLSGVALTPPTCAIRIQSINGIEVPAGATPEVEPLDNVVLTLAGSTPSTPDGSIVRYQWSIASKPAGSGVVLTRELDETTGFSFDNGDDLGVDIAGEYRVRAQVYDDLDVPSVNECEIAFEAIPKQNFLVQLTWDTPDNDMDLHVTRQDSDGRFCIDATGGASVNGLVTTECYNGLDCNFAGCDPGAPAGPEWDGAMGRSVGDPVLDIDDLFGFGPENINVDEMTPGRYGVGVVGYSTGNAYPVSGCTVRIFVYGRLAAEFFAEVGGNDWWEVALVHWPETAGERVCIEDLTDGSATDDCGEG